jgi:hypothetical protein
MPLAFSRLSAALAAASLLAGCAPSGDFPSLAMRPVERDPAAEPERPAPPQAPADPQLTGRIGELLAQVRQGETAFRAALPDAQRAARAAGGAGSESWIAAQQEISRLEAARAPTVTALAELDRLGIERGNMPTAGTDLQALLSANEEAGALAAAQRAEIDRLSGALSPT